MRIAQAPKRQTIPDATQWIWAANEFRVIISSAQRRAMRYTVRKDRS